MMLINRNIFQVFFYNSVLPFPWSFFKKQKPSNVLSFKSKHNIFITSNSFQIIHRPVVFSSPIISQFYPKHRRFSTSAILYGNNNEEDDLSKQIYDKKIELDIAERQKEHLEYKVNVIVRYFNEEVSEYDREYAEVLMGRYRDQGNDSAIEALEREIKSTEENIKDLNKSISRLEGKDEPEVENNDSNNEDSKDKDVKDSDDDNNGSDDNNDIDDDDNNDGGNDDSFIPGDSGFDFDFDI